MFTFTFSEHIFFLPKCIYYPAMHLRELEYTLPAALHTAAPARSANTIALPLPCAPLLLAHPSPPCGVAEPQRAARAAMTALGSGGGVQVEAMFSFPFLP